MANRGGELIEGYLPAMREVETERDAALAEVERLRARQDRLDVVLAAHDETGRYSGQPWGEVPVAEVRAALAGETCPPESKTNYGTAFLDGV